MRYRRRKGRRKNQANVLLRPREKSRVYRRGPRIKKKRKKQPSEYNKLPRPIVRSSRSFARSYYIITIKWRIVVQSALCFWSDGHQRYQSHQTISNDRFNDLRRNCTDFVAV